MNRMTMALVMGLAALWHPFSPVFGESSIQNACVLSGTVIDLHARGVQQAVLELTQLRDEEHMVPGMLYLGTPRPIAQSPHTTYSGAGGSFCFSAIPAGQYLLQARKEGFLDTNYGTTSPSQLSEILDIGEGRPSVVSMRLLPAGSISGKVSDGTRKAVTRGVVQLLTRVWFRGGPRWVVVKGSQLTPLGDYRIGGVHPGRYDVRFQPLDTGTPCAGDSGPQPVGCSVVPTYYPSGGTAGAAVPVVVGLGEALTEINIVAREGASRSVGGRLLISGRSPEFASLQLLGKGEEPTAWIVGSSMVGDGGAFRFLNVAPGEYSLFYLAGSGRGISVAATDLSVRDRDVSGVHIEAPAPVSVRGIATVEGSVDVRLNGVKVSLVAAGRIMDPNCIAEVRGDGVFVLESCSPGRYSVSVTSVPPTHYVREIFYGGSRVSNGPFSVDQGAGELKVVLRRGAARIRGRLLPARSGWYLVAPKDQPLQLVAGHSDSGGMFLVEGLPPGRYDVVGLAAPSPSAFHNPEVVRALASLGTEIVLGENEEAVITTRLLSAAEGDGAVAAR